VSGFEYTLTGGLGGPSAPAYGSFDPSAQTTAVLRQPWVALTPDQRRGATPLVATVAGRLGAGIAVTVQYAKTQPDGRVQVVGSAPLDDGRRDEAPWREIRLDLSRVPDAQDATQVRLVATDTALGPEGWVALAPLRAPQLAPLSQVVGNRPMFLEYPVSLASPCLTPFTSSSGIAQVPAYRLRADASRMRTDGENWSSPQAGGPRGWIDVVSRREEIPTYLNSDPGRDWGRVEALEPYEPTAVGPTVIRTDTTIGGLTSTGQLGDPPPGVPSPER
jgi:arabinosyltransferase C